MANKHPIVSDEEENEPESAENDSDENLFSDLDEDELPEDIAALIADANDQLQPQKSKELYNATYKKFIDWKNEHKLKGEICENYLLGYFNYMARNKKIKATTLVSHYSMLKNTIHLYHQIDISTFLNLRAFLKNKNKGHRKKKSKIFSPEEVKKFVEEAPDEKWLAVKVVLILGMSGACRRVELWQMTTDDVSDQGACLLINIPESKTDKPRQFAVVGRFYEIVKRYIALRPPDYTNKNFFIKYQDGKCHRQNIGIHSIGGMPKAIALYLKLPTPELYTGHAFRRSSATVYVNSGANITDLKRHGGWTSDTVAEGYIEESEARKLQVGQQITNAIFRSNNNPPITPSNNVRPLSSHNIPRIPLSNVPRVSDNVIPNLPPVPPDYVSITQSKRQKTMHSATASSSTVHEAEKENVSSLNVVKTTTTPSSTITTRNGISLYFENCTITKILICESVAPQQLDNA